MFYILRRKGLGLGSTKAIQQYSKHNIKIIRNDKNHIIDALNETDTVLRWGCTSTLPTHTKVLNKADNISFVNNKAVFRQKLQNTYPEIVPKTWVFITDPNITYPCILRYKNHAQGKHLYFCKNISDVYKAIYDLSYSYNTSTSTNIYISEYIPKVAEYRVCFIQGRVAWVVRKIPSNPEAIAWNVAQDGKFENIKWSDWPINVIETAYVAHKMSGLYLSGVDVMVDKDGRSYILEVNSAPSHTSPYRQQCTTKCIDYGIDYGFSDMRPNMNYIKDLKWRHPALKTI